MSEASEQGPSVETAGRKPAAEEAAGAYVEVFVRPEDMQATAQALLDAAGEDVEAVQTVSGGFWVPEGIASAAGITPTDDRSVDPERTGDLAAREGSGSVVSADQVIADAIASGQVSPQAVGAVFASNSPSGQDEPEVAAEQQEIPAQPSPSSPSRRRSRAGGGARAGHRARPRRAAAGAVRRGGRDRIRADGQESPPRQ
jgi:hypothetical protein